MAAEKADHLEPESSAMDDPPDYDFGQIARIVFADAWNKDIQVRMFSSNGAPGPISDDMITLVKDSDDSYRVLYLHTPGVIFAYTRAGRAQRESAPKRFHEKPPSPADYHDLKPQRCEIAINPALGTQVVDLWHRVLLETRYYEAEPPPPADGYWAHFSMPYRNQFLSGMASAGVDDDSKAGLLMSIGFDLRNYCTQRDSTQHKQLRADVARLEKLYGLQDRR